MKKVFVTIALAAFQLVAVAQTVNVHFKNGQTIKYNSDNVDYVDFSEKAPDPTVSAGAVVDLGLSVYWCSCNVGAEAPEEYGDYYAWGETKPKSQYSKDNYSYYDANTTQYIDIGEDISGTEYDAATVNLGKDWRMPTKEEMQELIDNCTWEWTQINGINGFRVSSSNGNSIFLPAAGKKSYSANTLQSESLLYYTASFSGNQFYGKSDYGPTITEQSKYEGLTIRSVTNNPNAASDPVDHSQDNLVTDLITASFSGGAFSMINGKIQGNSQIGVNFINGSSETVTLIGIQLNDGETGTEGNNLLEGEVEVAAGETKSYTVTVGWAGISKPIIKFTYRYNQKKYIAEATMNMDLPF